MKVFLISKGIFQGDPLSPFLFIIAMEGLNIVMKTTCEKGLFSGLKLPIYGPIISHIFYANDALFIGESSISNIMNLARILRCFHTSSGLKVNLHKSKVFVVGALLQETSSLAHILGCEPSSLPFNYLGVLFEENMNLKRKWNPIIERFQAKLSSWK